MFDRKIIAYLSLLFVTLISAGCGNEVEMTPVETGMSATDTLPPPTTTPKFTPSPDRQEPTQVKGDPEISLSSLSTAVGSDVEIRGQGFPPDQDLNVGFGRVNSEYEVIGQVRSEDDGSLQTTVTVPDFVAPEDTWVIVVASVEDTSVKAISEEIEITSERENASISVSPRTLSVGGEVTITGTGFPAQSAVQLGIGRVDSEYDLISEAETDADGALETQMIIPEFVGLEDKWVIVVTASEGRIKAFSEELEITE